MTSVLHKYKLMIMEIEVRGDREYMGALYFSALLFYKLKISLKNEVCYIKSMKNFKGKISQDSIAKCIVQTKLVMVTQRTRYYFK